MDLRDLCVVTASNDDDCLRRNLLASSRLGREVPVHVERGAASASVAYNRGLDATAAPLVLFLHQDVFLPEGWERRLARAVAALDALDPDWAVAAPFGMAPDGEHRGDVWSTSLGRRVGRPVTEPLPAQSFDELAILLRRASGLRFDDRMPRFHLYGTDIVQAARARGQGAYVVDLPVVHNDRFHGYLGEDFAEAYRFVRAKWRDRLPLRSPVLPVTRSGLALPLYRLRAWRSLARRRAVAADPGLDPRLYAAQAGWPAAAGEDRTAPEPRP